MRNPAHECALDCARAQALLCVRLAESVMHPIWKTRERLAKVIARGEVLQTSMRQGLAVVDDASLTAWRMNASTVISQLVSEKHSYQQQFERLGRDRKLGSFRLLECTLGVLVGLRDDFDSGALSDLRKLARTEMLIDFLDRADDLFARGYYGAAVVIAGEILEYHLLRLGELHGCDADSGSGITAQSTELMKAGAYASATHERVRGWAEVAERAREGALTNKSEAEDLLRGLPRFLDDNPAHTKTPRIADERTEGLDEP